MKVPTWIQLLLLSGLLGAVCFAVARYVAESAETPAASIPLIGAVFFVPVFKIMLNWQKIVWESSNAR